MKKALITLVTVFVCLTSNIAFGQDAKDVEYGILRRIHRNSYMKAKNHAS